MKKIILFILVSFLFIFSSCKKNNQQLQVIINYGEGYDNIVIDCDKSQNIYEDLILKEDNYKKVVGFKTKDGTVIDKSYILSGSIEVYAIWENKEYTYKFYNGSDLIKEKTDIAGSTIEYPDDLPNKDYGSFVTTFKGWDHSDTVLLSNIEFKAIFEDVDKVYTYTFYDSDRKTVLKQGTGSYGTVIEYPNNPSDKVFEGYKMVFKEWRYPVETLTEDVDIYATYKRVNDIYTISYYNYDNTLYMEDFVEYQEYAVEIEDPNKETHDSNTYYKFLGWYTENNELFDFYKQITSNVSIYPKNETGTYGSVSLEEARISILGDSISTYYSPSSPVNSVYTGTNQYYYPTYSNTVIAVNQTWWYKTITNVGAQLGVNNSLSGSAAFGSSSSAGSSPNRLKSLSNKGIPNIIFVYLGTNDNVNGHTVENIEYAYRKIIEYIQENYIEKRDNIYIRPIIYLFCTGYTAYSGYNYTEDRRVEYNNKLIQLSTEYSNVKIFNLGDFITKDNYLECLGDNLHYNSYGMNLIAEKLTARLHADFDETSTINNNIQTINNQHYRVIKRKDEFENEI